ncbi:MAG: HypC/HybG/HupF family hydrogenase formation chaperone [Archaeoglobaceae archaeon]|nr:HypC/HybG/HupF family hydrogenase formation chaperone [Archaeoglobaceae archaeon]HDD36625.1 HypC/HybG/HupF family hydrogenase formation chaperone [Archaeoglobus veneficus]
MCLAIIGKVESIEYPFATVNFKGTKKKVRIDLIEDLKIGEYVLVHVGFAIQKVDSREVEQYNEIWENVINSLQ